MEPTYGFNAWLTLTAIVIGPLAAVGITLWIEGRRKDREQKIQVARMLLTTRHLPSDPAYSLAINLIPVEFNADARVMTAWNEYIEAVRYTPAPQNESTHLEVARAKQTGLIHEVLQSLGFNLSETQIKISAYAAEGWARRDDLYIDYLRATREIALSLREQTDLFRGQA
jgi:hypothetical protein